MRDPNELLLCVFPTEAQTHKSGTMLLRAHVALAGVSLQKACPLELPMSGRYIGLALPRQQH